MQSRIHQEFPLHSVIYEEHIYPTVRFQSEEEKTAWDWFFQQRQLYEVEAFGPIEPPDTLHSLSTHRLSPGTLNHPNTLELLEQMEPDLILLFDTSIISEKILNRFSGRIWNLHVGLSEHYRGSSCNFWPIYEEQLDKLGATILTIDPGIDTGGILAQSSIHIEKEDTLQSLIGKTIVLGTDLMLETLRRWNREPFSTHPLKKRGKLFLKKEFQPEAVLKVKQWVERGELQERINVFLKNRQ